MKTENQRKGAGGRDLDVTEHIEFMTKSLLPTAKCMLTKHHNPKQGEHQH